MVNIFNEENFEEEVMKTNETVIVDFYADWCGPCKIMSPVIDSLAEENLTNVKIGKINVDENPDLSEKYQVMSIPTILFFKNGKVVQTYVGVTEKQQLKNALSYI